jgi:hypothetical protein
MGLLDELTKYKFNPNATSMGLLQAGAQMLANSGPSYQPQGGFGSALGQGLGGFTQGYTGFNQNQQEQEMLRQRMELDRKKLAQEQFRLDNPQHSVDPYFSVVATPQGMMSFNARTGEMSPINVGGKPVMKSNDDVGLQGALSQAKDANQYTKVTLGDGREVMMSKGTAAQLSGAPQYQPTPMQETVGNVTYDFKNPQQAMQDIKTGIREGGSGDAELDALVAASQRQYEQRNGIGQSTAALEAEKTKAALMEAEGKAEIELNQKAAQAEQSKARAGQNINEMLSIKVDGKTVDDLIDESTGSLVGTGIDLLGSSVGISSQSSRAAKQLETLSGWLVSNVPRMEGPQSNFDVENYKVMAGMIGNPKAPAEDKKAALTTLKEIVKKYQPGQSAAPMPEADKRSRLDALRAKWGLQQ